MSAAGDRDWSVTATRPKSVTLAGRLTIGTSSACVGIFVASALAIGLNRDQYLADNPGVEPARVSLLVGVLVVFAIWSLGSLILAMSALNRSSRARRWLLTSAISAALISLVATFLFAFALIILIATSVVIYQLSRNESLSWFQRPIAPDSAG